MLRAVVIGKLGTRPAVVKGNTVIVEDSLGNPLAAIVETSERMNLVVTVKDKDFNNVLRGLGINKVVVEDPMPLEPPPSGARRLDQEQLAGFIHGN